jgi:hypothetical protein
MALSFATGIIIIKFLNFTHCKETFTQALPRPIGSEDGARMRAVRFCNAASRYVESSHEGIARAIGGRMPGESKLRQSSEQCWGSVTFWFGFPDPYL